MRGRDETRRDARTAGAQPAVMVSGRTSFPFFVLSSSFSRKLSAREGSSAVSACEVKVVPPAHLQTATGLGSWPSAPFDPAWSPCRHSTTSCECRGVCFSEARGGRGRGRRCGGLFAQRRPVLYAHARPAGLIHRSPFAFDTIVRSESINRERESTSKHRTTVVNPSAWLKPAANIRPTARFAPKTVSSQHPLRSTDGRMPSGLLVTLSPVARSRGFAVSIPLRVALHPLPCKSSP